MGKTSYRKAGWGVVCLCVGCVVLGISRAGAQSFVFTSGLGRYDSAFADAKANIKSNTVTSADGSSVFNAGAFWDEVWERDGSYSIEMACGHLDPATSKNTFTYNTATWNNLTVQRQDVCGDYGGWPNLTDGIVWATGAWAYYRQTGDANFLAFAYPIVRNSLLMAETPATTDHWVVLDAADSLYRGCSSFMESRSAYPPVFDGNENYSNLSVPSVGNSKCGSTNMLYYHAWVIADSMAKLLGKSQATQDSLSARAWTIKNAINRQLWNDSEGYYYYVKYADGKTKLNRNEGLADAFAILYDIADSAQKESILNKTIPSAWGYVCQYPRDTNWMCYTCGGDVYYYHNDMIWQFVQGYIAWAATKIKNMTAFYNNIHNCALLWSHSAPGEFREFFRPETGFPDGGNQQLWSAAGYISMVFHGLFGMNFDVDGVRFDPMVPDTFKNAMTLNKFIYRKDTLNMTVTGPGKYLQTFSLDGVQQAAFIPAALTGTHTVVMTMANAPVTALLQAHRVAAMESNRIRISWNSTQGMSLTFGMCQKVNATFYSLTGKCVAEFSTVNGTVTIGNHILVPGAYVVKWNSVKADGFQKIMLK